MKINNKFNKIISFLILSLLLIISVILSIGIVEAAPEQRIVSLTPWTTEILFEIGAGDRVVGVTNHCDYPPGATPIKKVGSWFNPSFEEIVNVTPTIVFAHPRHRDINLVDRIRGINIIVVVTDNKNIEEIYENIKYIGTYTGNSDEARAVVDRMRSRVQNIKNRVEGIPTERRPSVLVTWWYPMHAMGPDIFAGDVIRIAGGINVVREGRMFPIGTESIVAKNPYIKIVAREVDKARIMADPALSGIDAVVNGRVFVIRSCIILRAGPRIVYGIEDMHNIISRHLLPIPPDPDPGVTPPPVVVPAPNITSFAPSLFVNDFENATRTFNITIDQIVNVSWLINGTRMQTNVSRTDASYTNISASFGIWNISAVVNNPNGTDMQTWIWNVSAALPIAPPVTPLTGIHVSDATIIVNRTHDFNATPIPSGAVIGNITWTVGDTAIGTITPAGVFTTRAAGTTAITATYKGITGIATATVIAPPVTLTGIHVSDARIDIGKTHTFRASPIPADAVIGTVTWTVADPAIGTITPAGVFTARAAGTTTITATYRGFSANAIATVPAPAVPEPRIPGFGLIAAILGILGAIYYSKRKIR